jgi:GT2 family glycosyltransferase
MNPGTSGKVGVVAIGRNEGERLRRCLQSVARASGMTVYVDSGSADGSVDLARALGAEVVELDMRTPFTAARARNAGYRRLRQLAPGLAYVQFVDGDCEISHGWIETAMAWLDDRGDSAIACGRRRERDPGASVYNLLCDIEWDTPVGESTECGGDALIRVAAFDQVNGYREDLIAGEEPELCVRLRAAGWRIWRLDAPMTLHDASITRIGQWWKRALRAGYAAAQGVALHGAAPERHRVGMSRSIWMWALGPPTAASLFAAMFGPWAFALLLAYPLQVVRLAVRGRYSRRENWWYALFIVLGKFPELAGQLKFLAHRYVGGQPRLIEYK